jgi:uncharacterized membrane protein YhaH (DUF805 family)
MNFPDAVKSGFRNWNNFSGRASRSEYWWFTIFYFFVEFSLFIPILVRDSTSKTNPLFSLMWLLIGIPILSIVLMVPVISAQVRRYHDVNLAWQSCFTSKRTIALYQRGTIGPNRFGPDPLEGEAGHELS